MKTVSTDLATHLAGEVTTLATCWKITRRDSTVMGFTDHDKDLIVAGTTYDAATGFTPSAIANNASLAVDNLDVEGMISASSITEADIMAGKYDFAEIEIFKVNYADLAQGSLKLRRGWLGEVSLNHTQFVAEVRGLAQRLSQTIGELYSASCRATLGDDRCKVNMASHTHTGSVTTAISNQQLIDSSRTEPSDIFAFGTLTFTSGPNNGMSMEVKEYIYSATTGGKIVLALPMPNAIGVGNTYSMVKGCDKTLSTCKARFDNVLNFRGEPHVPGLDKMLETAGTKSTW